MKFLKRVWNLWTHINYKYFILPAVGDQIDRVRKEHDVNATVSGYFSTIKKHPVITPVNYAIDAPQPLMPHVITIPGLYIR